MMRSCSYCGGIHKTTTVCSRKPTRRKYGVSDADRFRRTSRWSKKSIEIRTRDKGLCQVCIRKLYNTQQQYTFDTIEVHHITPLNEDIRRGLDNTNLLTLCKYHHYMADDGDIPREVQYSIVEEQERLNNI